MSETETTPAESVPVQEQASFHIGNVLTATFKVVFSRFFYFFGVTFVGFIAAYTIAIVAALPFTIPLVDIWESGGDIQSNIGAIIGLVVFVSLVAMIGFAVVQGVIVRSAITVRLGQGARFGAAFRASLFGVLPLCGIYLLLVIPVYLGFILLVVPGLYLVAMFYLIIPAIVFEGRGFGAMGRSLSLTRGYRWAIIGYFLALTGITYVIYFAVSMVGAMITIPFTLSLEPGELNTGFIISQIISFALSLLGSVAMIAVGYVGVSTAYVRLREIKEGGGEELLKVFE